MHFFRPSSLVLNANTFVTSQNLNTCLITQQFLHTSLKPPITLLHPNISENPLFALRSVIRTECTLLPYSYYTHPQTAAIIKLFAPVPVLDSVRKQKKRKTYNLIATNIEKFSNFTKTVLSVEQRCKESYGAMSSSFHEVILPSTKAEKFETMWKWKREIPIHER